MIRAVADTRSALIGLVGRPVEAPEFSNEVSAALQGTLPFDGWCLFGVDPHTGLRTFQFGGRGTERTAEMARNEALMEDVNKYADLALAPLPAGWLSRNHPNARESFRLHEILLPQGFHSEIRLALRARGRMWGALVLFREDPSRPFDGDDTAMVCAIADPLASAVRAYPVRPICRRGSAPGAGVVALAPDNRLVAVSVEAQAWLGDLVPGGEDQTHAGDVTRVLFDAAHAVRSGDPSRASTCVRTVAGHWLRVEGTALSVGEADRRPSCYRLLLYPKFQGTRLCPRVTGSPRARQRSGLALFAVWPASRFARELAISPWTGERAFAFAVPEMCCGPVARSSSDG